MNPAPYIDGSPTSDAAALAIEPSRGTLQRRVLLMLRAGGGLTDEEMQELCVMNPSTQRPRRIELLRAGLIVDTGTKKRTKSGRWATVWGAK